MKKASGKKNIDIVQDYLNGERPFLQVGYVGDKDKYIIRKEGEIWEDSSGKKWKQTDHGPVSHTPIMDIIRAEVNQKCTGCGCEIRWGSRLDTKMFYRTSKCFDCQIEEETQLRIKGKFKLYETKKLLQNELGYLDDVRGKIKSSKDFIKDQKIITFVNSNGRVEEWDNVTRTELLNNLKKDHVTCLKKIKAARKELEKVEKEIQGVLDS